MGGGGAGGKSADGAGGGGGSGVEAGGGGGASGGADTEAGGGGVLEVFGLGCAKAEELRAATLRRAAQAKVLLGIRSMVGGEDMRTRKIWEQ